MEIFGQENILSAENRECLILFQPGRDTLTSTTDQPGHVGTRNLTMSTAQTFMLKIENLSEAKYRKIICISYLSKFDSYCIFHNGSTWWRHCIFPEKRIIQLDWAGS